ncbi:hypothetical protein [Pseudomonas oryzihabitans]|uniref:hypothetical protein n=1 Tax=Pseudomonas oryzihabitans TaxID=47885 RepID=UPI002859FF93|nr:hypothetical protein [Pseudomonas psychrotolerans]MDR6680164.1 hypothetical protein [Pseudomonas psychrotolerans]
MARLIISERLGQAWLAAARHLSGCKQRKARNLVLEISSPQKLEKDDVTIIRAVDAALRKGRSDLSIETVASTIFPNGLARRFERPELYTRYLALLAKGKKRSSWGTYAHRIMSRSRANGTGTMNPLDDLIERLLQTHVGTKYQAAFELGISDPEVDLAPPLEGYGGELPLFDPTRDARALNVPCLSHLSFKITDAKLDLTAIYRSQWYCQRALGNLVGLSQLQSFVGRESKYECGTLTCIATHAYLDTETFGKIEVTKDLLASLPS